MTTQTERWLHIWSHREQLLKVARRRTVSLEDAEDAVHEAMLRASERPYLDDERLGAWLTTVTMRLCVDRHRQFTRDAQMPGHLAYITLPPVEDEVCDRAEARWLAGRSEELPPRQAEALRLKAEDLDVGQVAREMGLNYRTVESLLARARRTLRRSLAGTLAVLCWLTARSRHGGGTPGTAATAGASGMQLAGMASTAATLAVLGFAVPGSLPPGPADPVPPAGYQAAEGDRRDAGRGERADSVTTASDLTAERRDTLGGPAGRRARDAESGAKPAAEPETGVDVGLDLAAEGGGRLDIPPLPAVEVPGAPELSARADADASLDLDLDLDLDVNVRPGAEVTGPEVTVEADVRVEAEAEAEAGLPDISTGTGTGTGTGTESGTETTAGLP
jgi:RNA polymerase sigma factor (sigma-70 family)